MQPTSPASSQENPQGSLEEQPFDHEAALANAGTSFTTYGGNDPYSKAARAQGIAAANNMNLMPSTGASILMGAINGPAKFVGNTADFFMDMGGPHESVDIRPFAGNAQGVLGGMAEDLSDFAFGSMLLGGFLPSKLGAVTKAFPKSLWFLKRAEEGVIGALAFDEHQGHLSDLFKDTPILGSVTSWLQTSEDDNALTGRLKSAMEGVGMSFAFDMVFKSAKLLRAQKAGATGEVAQLAKDVLTDFKAYQKGGTLLAQLDEPLFKQILVDTRGATVDEAESVVKAFKAQATVLGSDFNNLIRKRVFGFIKSTPEADLEATIAKVAREPVTAPSVVGATDVVPNVGEGTVPSPKAAVEYPTSDLNASKGNVGPAPTPGSGVTPSGNNVSGYADFSVNGSADTMVQAADKIGVGNKMPKVATPGGSQVSFGASDSSTFMGQQTNGVLAGAVHFVMNEQRAIVKLFAGAGPDTVIHELSHVLRRDLSGEVLSKIEATYNVVEGKWSVAQEEAFANDVTQRIMTAASLGNKFRPSSFGLGSGASDWFGHVVRQVYDAGKALYHTLGESGEPVGNRLNKLFGNDFTAVSSELTKAGVDAKEAGVALAEQIANYGKPLAAPREGNAWNRLLENFKLGDGGENLVNTAQEVARTHNSLGHVSDKETMASAMALVNKTGISLESIVGSTGKTARSMKDIQDRVGAAIISTSVATRDMNAAIQGWLTNKTPESLYNALKVAEQFQQVNLSMAQIRRGSALALRANRIIPKVDGLEALKELAKMGNGKGQRLVELIESMGVASENSGYKGMSKLLGKFNTNVWDSVLEFRYGAMLSGPAGVVADAFGNTVKTLVTPLEKIIAGVGSGISTGDYSLIREGVGTYIGLANTIKESLSLMGTAAKGGVSILDNSLEGSTFAITASKYGMDSATSLGHAIDLIGTGVRLPSRIRMSGDEFFKQWNYRGLLWQKYSQEAMDAAASKMIPNTSDAIQSFIRGKMDDAVDIMGRGQIPEALKYAREQTFSQPLSSSVGRMVLHAANEHKMIRVLLPFIKTPTNIFKDITGHTPILGALLKEQRQALMFGTANERTQVLAKWAMGGFLYTGAVMMAQQGNLTGSGGSDRAANEAKRLGGWQPYSLAVDDGKGGKTYYAYNRLDPLGAFLGLASDYHELSLENEGKGLEKLGVSMMAAFSKVVLSKTYLKGMSDLTKAIDAPDRSGPKLIQGLAATFVPQGLAVANQDPYIREVQDMADAMKRKVPGLSSTLSPTRNVLGEPIDKTKTAFLPDGILPVYMSHTVSDPVKQELASLGSGLSGPSTKLMGTDLTQLTTASGQAADDRLKELVGQVKVNGVGIRDALDKMIKTKDYQTLKAAGPDLNPQRQQAINGVLLKYHQEARRQLLRDNPNIMKVVQDTKQTEITQQTLSLSGAIRAAKQQRQ